MAFMKLQSALGDWVELEVRGETRLVGPDLVTIDLLIPLPPGREADDDNPARTIDVTDGCSLDGFIDATIGWWLEGGEGGDDMPILARKAAVEAWEDMLAGLQDCVGPKLTADSCDEVRCFTSWAARYSAPGYMDCTDWTLGDSEADAIAECKSVYGDDDEEEEEEEDTALSPTATEEE